MLVLIDSSITNFLFKDKLHVILYYFWALVTQALGALYLVKIISPTMGEPWSNQAHFPITITSQNSRTPTLWTRGKRGSEHVSDLSLEIHPINTSYSPRQKLASHHTWNIFAYINLSVRVFFAGPPCEAFAGALSLHCFSIPPIELDKVSAKF